MLGASNYCLEHSLQRYAHWILWNGMLIVKIDFGAVAFINIPEANLVFIFGFRVF